MWLSINPRNIGNHVTVRPPYRPAGRTTGQPTLNPCVEACNLTLHIHVVVSFLGLSAGTGRLCIFGHLGLVFIWSCFVSCLLLLLYYVICPPVLTEGTSFLKFSADKLLAFD